VTSYVSIFTKNVRRGHKNPKISKKSKIIQKIQNPKNLNFPKKSKFSKIQKIPKNTKFSKKSKKIQILKKNINNNPKNS
jgi:hypothetical protein